MVFGQVARLALASYWRVSHLDETCEGRGARPRAPSWESRTLRAVDSSARESSRLRRLAPALLAGVLALVALTGASAAGTSRLDECVSAVCEGDDVTVSAASQVPGRASESAPACLHDAGCGGAHGGGAAGLNLAAVPLGLAAVIALRPQGSARRAAAGMRSLLFGRQLYRPPRFA